MCFVCTKYQQEKLTYNEAMKALKEFALDPIFVKEHLDLAIDYIDSVEIDRDRKQRHDKS